MRILRAFAVAAILSGVPSAGRCATVHVPGEQPSIQAGVLAASDGDTVLVAPGTYHEGILIDGRSVVVRSVAGPEGTLVDASGLPTAFMFEGAIGFATVVKGFSIENASAEGVLCRAGTAPRLMNLIVTSNTGRGLRAIDAAPSVESCAFCANGGYGVRVDGGTPSFRECTFHSNGDYGMWLAGGEISLSACVFYTEGVSVTHSAHLDITGCQFLGYGPAGYRPLRSPGLVVDDASLTASGCTFEAYKVLSAMRLYDTGPVLLEDCLFTGNTGDLGPAVYAETAPVTASGCRFEANTSSEDGGAVVLRWGQTTEFADCTFIGNGTPGLGGGISVHDCRYVTFSGCDFRENWSGDDGGGLRVYGPNACDVDIDHCLFVDNTCLGTGSAIRLSSCDGVIENCTIVGGSAGPAGGSVHLGGSTMALDVRECIVTAGEGYGISLSSGSVTPYILYCDVFDMSSGLYAPPMPDMTGYYGNISEDPMFCKPSEGNYYLDENSPCAAGGSGGDYIGAFGAGCGGTAVKRTSWGAIKGMFR